MFQFWGRRTCLFLGPNTARLLSFFFGLRCRILASVATAFFQWARFVRTQTAKIPLYINMDETSLGFHYGGQKGTVISKRSLPPGRSHRREQASLADTRAHVSHLAFVTHDSGIQAKLPQVFIGNKHQFTLKLLGELAPDTPVNIYLWRETSAWNSHILMRRVLSVLVRHLNYILATHEIILVLDVARCHIHATIFQLASRLGVRLLHVPAKLTWLLQPADTHVFAQFKRQLRARWLQLRVASDTGEVSLKVWLLEVFQVAQTVYCSNKWKPAFEGDVG